jgi:ABC-type sugar transport system ATPase subunit
VSSTGPGLRPMDGDEAEPVFLAVDKLSVMRGNTLALDEAHLSIQHAGTVHALLGQNGCGKSTLLGVLSGQLRPHAGTISIAGQSLAFNSTVESRSAGVVMVSQELSLAPDLSVAENVLMGRALPRSAGVLRWKSAYGVAKTVLSQLGLEVDPRTRTGDLRPDQQQLVEIGRSIRSNPSILILDEPTSSLSRDEVEALFVVIRRLSTTGVTTIIVSHRLVELYEICDSITVLRDGRTVHEGPMSATTTQQLVAAMVGQEDTQPAASAASPVYGKTVLETTGLGSSGAFNSLDLQVRRGEIVGLAGLSGSGCSEVLQSLAGTLPIDEGIALLDSQRYRPISPRDALAARVGYLPPDRKRLGLHLSMSVSDNLALSATRDRFRLKRPIRDAEQSAARRFVTQAGVRTPSVDTAVGSLSGGNQQKVALGKCLADQPMFLLLDEPTRGVDVKARADIHQNLADTAAAGVGVLITSSDADEFVDLCHRVLVLANGKIQGELVGGQISESHIAFLAGSRQS